MGVSDIKAGEAYVRMSVRDEVQQGLARVEKSLLAFGKRLSLAGAGILGIGTAIAAPLALAVRHFAETGGQLTDMSARTGIAVEALQELGYAAEQTGASLDDVEIAVKKMQVAVSAAAGGSEKAQDALAKVGLSAQSLAGLRPDEQLLKIGEGLSRIESPAQRAAAAVAIFGRSGTKLLSLFSEGAAGAQKMMQEARQLGLVLSREDVAAGDAVGDTLDQLIAQFRALQNQIGAALAPALLALAQGLKAATAAVIFFVREHRGLVTSVAAAAAILAGLGLTLLAIGGTATVASFAMRGLSTAIGWVTAAATVCTAALSALWAAIITPAGIVAVAVIALAATILWLTGAASDFGSAFSHAMGTAASAFQGFSDAIIGGDLELAFKILKLGITVEWTRAMQAMTEAWQGFKLAIVLGVNELAAAFGRLWNNVSAGVAAAAARMQGLLNPLADTAGKLATIESNRRVDNVGTDFNRDLANDAARKSAAGATSEAQQAALDALQEFEQARAEAAAKRAEREKAFVPPEFSENKDQMKEHLIRSGLSTGAFNAQAASMLNRSGSTFENQQLKETKRAADSMEDAADDLAKIREAVEGGLIRFA